MTVAITYTVDTSIMDRDIAAETERIRAGLVAGVKDILDLVEGIQAGTYTPTGKPPPPAGSTYERTMTLQKASKKEMISEQLPNIEGRWYIDELIASYGDYVLGKRSRQARVHRGRWVDQGHVEAVAKAEEPRIMARHL